MVSEYKVRSEVISIDHLSYASDFGSEVEKTPKFRKIFKISKEKSKGSVRDFESDCSKALSQGGIRRDVTNKKILRAIRKFYKNIIGLKVGRMNIVTRNPSKFLEGLKRKIRSNSSLSTLFQGELVRDACSGFEKDEPKNKGIGRTNQEENFGNSSSVGSSRTSDSVSLQPFVTESILEILLWFALPKCYHSV